MAIKDIIHVGMKYRHNRYNRYKYKKDLKNIGTKYRHNRYNRYRYKI